MGLNERTVETLKDAILLLLCVDVGIGMSGVPQPVYGFK
jgi:hypothetical protein